MPAVYVILQDSLEIIHKKRFWYAIPRPSYSKAYDIFSIHIIVTSVGHFLEKMYVFCNIFL